VTARVWFQLQAAWTALAGRLKEVISKVEVYEVVPRSISMRNGKEGRKAEEVIPKS
jgi:hypothetical protein